MKKIAINKCYGGFHPSDEVVEEYLKRSNIYFVKRKDRYKRMEFWGENDKYLSYMDISRDDPTLIEILEEFISKGKEINTDVSRISIVEIPDDVEYSIEEYDGIEWISEKHRTWG